MASVIVKLSAVRAPVRPRMRSAAQHRALRCSRRLQGVLHLVGRHHQIESFCGQMVKLCRVLKHGGVATRSRTSSTMASTRWVITGSTLASRATR